MHILPKRKTHQFPHRPDMIGDPLAHARGHPLEHPTIILPADVQAHMGSAKVVIRTYKIQGVQG